MVAPVYKPTDGRMVLSQSSLEEYLRCGLAYRMSRDTRYRRSTVAMSIGSAIAEAAKADALQKLHGGPMLPLKDIVDVAVTEYERETTTCELSEGKLDIDAGRDEARECARIFALHISPKIVGVLAAEEPLYLDIDDGLRLQGTPDIVTVHGIGDLKVGQPWTEDRVHRSRQLTLYSALYLEAYHRLPARVWIDSINRRERSAERLWSQRTDEDIAVLFHVIQQAVEGIQAGVALPAPEAAWWCSRKWCPHWHTCPAIAKGRCDGSED